MRQVRTAAVMLVASGAIAGCGSADQADTGLLAEATVTTGSGCPEAEVLASMLETTGVTYDYDPSRSPRRLALATDAVVRGRLTGRVAPGDVGTDDALDLGFDLEDVVVGDDIGSVTPAIARLRVTLSPARQPEQAASVAGLAGLEVIAFVSITSAEDGGAPAAVGVPAAPEGLMASCTGERLVGWHGDGADWSLQTLDDVAVAAL